MISAEEEGFEIRGHTGDYVRLVLAEVYGFPDSTCHWGGYDARAQVEIVAGDFRVMSTFFTATGEIYNLFQQLLQCNQQLKGEVDFASYEGNLQLKIGYSVAGHVTIHGRFKANSQFENELKFGIETDQTFIRAVLGQMKPIVVKYGGMHGVRG